MAERTAGVRHPPEEDGRDFGEVAEYLSREDVNDFVSKANKKYYHWDGLVYRDIPEDTNYEDLWFLIKYVRSTNMKNIDVGSIELKYYLTDDILEKLNKFDMSLGGKIEASSLIPDEDRESYLVSSLMEEAIASSQLEGAATTREEAKKMLRRGQDPRDKSEKMIMNNYNTIRQIREWKDKELTPELIRELHESMTEGTLDDSECGQFRQSNDVKVIDNDKGETLHVPPDYEDVPKMIEDLCEFANEEQTFIHPIIKATVLHFCLGYIHPFVDGNGRTARAVFYWYLIAEDYWIVEFLSISRIIKNKPGQYKEAYIYTETDENDLTYFINFQLDTLEQALDELKEYIERKMKERQQLYNFKRMEDINDRQVDVLNEFAEKPEKDITIREHQTTFNVAYDTARRDLHELVDKDLLVKKQVGNKYVFFRSDGFDEIIKNHQRESGELEGADKV